MSTTGRTTTSPSTTLTTETSLSLLYRVLRKLIRPFRPALVKPGNPLPAGSPRLTKYPQSKNGCTITEHHDHDLWLYDFTPPSIPNHQTEKHHRVLYFAGGGFQSPPANEHWGFVSNLAAQLAGTHDFTIVSYPLAPNSPAYDSLPVLRRYVSAVCKDALRTGSKVSLMGDSAGGNVALSLGLWLVDRTPPPPPPQQQNKNISAGTGTDTDVSGDILPASIIVISPAVDLRNVNPEIERADRYDPVLSVGLIEQVAAAWARPPQVPTISLSTDSASREKGRSDPYLSPVLVSETSLKRVKEVGVRVHGVIGTHDVLAPDALAFRQRCVDADVPGDWLVWEGQMHCFVLASVYGMSEGKQATRWVIETMKKNT